MDNVIGGHLSSTQRMEAWANMVLGRDSLRIFNERGGYRFKNAIEKETRILKKEIQRFARAA